MNARIHIWILLLLFFPLSNAIYSQTSLTLEVDGGGSNTICRGGNIQINAIADPPNDTYTYVWRNVNTGQEIKREVGDPGTFHFFGLIQQGFTIEVQVSGGGGFASQTIQVILEDPPNPGTEGNLLLCNLTGAVELFTLLQGNPDPGGTWTDPNGNPFGANDRGNFVIGTDPVGEYLYALPGNAFCAGAEAKVVVRECVDDDFDNDGVLNDVDLDDDNDGILDTVENSSCGSMDLTEVLPLVDIDFGFGSTPTTDPNILGHSYITIWPNDGQYNVGTSTFFLGSANFDVFFVATNANPIANSDGSGDVDGRYLAINIAPNFINQPIYQIDNIPIVAGSTYNFRIDLAGLCDDPAQCQNAPQLLLELIDQNLPAGSAPIFTETSAGLGVANDDVWNTLRLNFTATTTTFLTLNIVNEQPLGNNGNDIGIDNIRFAELGCDFDRDEIPNSVDLDNDNDGIYDVVEAGFGNLDSDGDGIIDGAVDANGVPVAASGGLTPVNSDGTGLADYQDIDADDDGIQDNIEGQSTAGYIAPSGVDSNANGVDDVYESGNNIDPVDTDMDGTPDYLDLNSDDDCLDDTTEAYDLDQDGVSDITASGADADADGLDDAFDTVTLDDTTDVTNPTDGGELPTNLPDNHNPGNDVDFREEFIEVDEMATVDGCADGIPTINLFDSLVDAAIPGGTWTGPSPLTGGDLGTFTAATNVAGVYVYTLPMIGTCPERKGTVNVTIVAVPDAGEDGALNICSGETPVDLFDSLTGTPETGGVWTDGAGTTFGADDRGTFDPSADAAGTYTYTVGTAGCSRDAVVVVTLNLGADAGEDGAIDFCDTNTSVDLFDSIGGTPDIGGTWTDPNGNPFGADDRGTIDPSLATALSGVYTYTVSSASCPVSSSSTVTVTIETTPELTSVVTTCSSDRSTYGVSFVTNGAWDLSIFPAGSGTIDAANNMITGITAGVDISIIAENPSNDNCEVLIDVTAPDCNCPDITEPTNPSNESICEGSAAPVLSVDVLAGQTANWYDASGMILISNSTTFTPTDTAAGDYIYSVEAFDTTENCASDRIDVLFSILSEPVVDPIPPVSSCEEYELPVLSVGNYYTQTNGGGTQLAAGDIITISQVIYVYAETGTTPNCFDEEELDIIINPLPNPVAPVNSGDRFCESYTLPNLIAGQNYYTGSNGSGTQLNAGDEIQSSQTIFLQEIDSNGCQNEVEFFVEIVNIEELEIEPGIICISSDFVSTYFIDTELSDADFSFEWSLNGTVIAGATQSFYEATEEGSYTVTYTDIVSMCQGNSEITVQGVNGPQDLDLQLSNGSFAESNDIIATVTGNGESQYVYSLDNGVFQDSNIFTNVSLGFHLVTVEDINGCGSITDGIFVVGFPNFFTPNNDGQNDVWNVKGDANVPDMDIFIFDRYGKLLTQLTPDSLGWDGTYNGLPQPASDYWFMAQLKDGSETFRSHFSLIR
ncbi:T9SS type B sorting domain-containing protein [Aquimarina sp. RZ0]|uniref:T9SS type B sorting domain-containing protein n=1 Tax=Aquimarina sp. RZ0 TaxID=2607730 RepID=UPI0011F11B40|nr:T9SS type B sorting domain-containing protein [Aquimarina sp. RZ0]KAA1242632.1 T9SS type B sorting domain-containing protein [Aquimarina sp. RZ0]